jgi:uncharacterized membrane-anchored protein YitT (DUF2179 family)
MAYEFSIVSFFIGFIIVAVGTAFMLWHQKIADALGSGVSSYERFKFWAFIAICVGFVVMLNLHEFILGNLLISLFHPA